MSAESSAACVGQKAEFASKTLYATIFITALNIAFFLSPYVLSGLFPDTETLLRHLRNTPGTVWRNRELWQLITANFVHNGFIHLSINLLFLVWFGSRLERVWGSRRFLAFYLATGVFSQLLHAWAATWGLTADVTCGASGCVLGILTVHALTFPEYEILWYGAIRVRLWWVVLLLIFSDVSSLFPPGGILGISNIVHLGGAVFGATYWMVAQLADGRLASTCPNGSAPALMSVVHGKLVDAEPTSLREDEK